MNKQFLAATLAAALMVPMASHAVDATLYGSIRVGLASGDDDGMNSDRELDLGATGNNGGVRGQGLYSRIGVRGSSELDNGMTAGLHLERGVGAGALTTRHTNVWLEGGFGRLTFGQQNNPYRKARKWDQSWFLGGQFGADGGSRIEGINYSMSSGPFSLNVMATADDREPIITSATAGTTVHYYTTAPEDGATALTAAGATDPNHVPGAALFIPVDAMEEERMGTCSAIATGAMGCARGYTLSAPADSNPNNNAGPSSITRVVGATPAVTDDSNGVDSWVVHAGYDFGVVNLDVAIRTEETDALAGRDNTAIGVNGSVGSLDWYLAYQTSELANAPAGGDDEEVTSIGGFLGFKASDRDTIYAYYVNHSADLPTGQTTYSFGGTTLGETATETIFGYSRSFGAGVSFHAEYLTVDKDLPTGMHGNSPDTLVLAMKVDF